MTETRENRPLFRPEAVEAHARGRGVEDEGLDLRENRTTWAYRLLVLGLLLAIVVGLTTKVEETAHGTAHVAGSTVRVDVPIGALSRLQEGQLVRLDDLTGRVAMVNNPTSDAAGRPVVPVIVTFPADARPVPGEATVRLSRRTLAQLLLKRGGDQRG